VKKAVLAFSLTARLKTGSDATVICENNTDFIRLITRRQNTLCVLCVDLYMQASNQFWHNSINHNFVFAHGIIWRSMP